MGRACRVCVDPALEEINHDLMDGKSTLAEIEAKYGIGYTSLYRHRSKHLKPLLDEIKENAKVSATKDYIDGQAAAQSILKYLPEVLRDQKPSLREIIEVIKIVNGGSGVVDVPKDVVITWGIGAGDKGKIQIANAIPQPEGITDSDVTELESETEKRKTAKSQ